MEPFLSQEHEMIRQMVKDFAEKEVEPVVAELDKKGIFPREILKKMAKLGLMGMPVPKEYGGQGTDTLSYILAIEEISRIWASLGVILAVHTSVGTMPIYYYGTEEQKKKFLPPLAKGEKLGAFAITEPEAGSDVAAVKTSAVRQGDHYILNGGKIFITNGKEADYLIVLAVTDKEKGTKGMSTFIVEKGFEGFSYGTTEEKMGMNSSDTTELVFKDCRVPAENLLGKEGEGFKIALSALDGGRIGIGAQCVGIARAAFEASLKYAKERIQFGRPIGKFQAINFMLTDMATKIEASRLLVYRAAMLKDSNKRFTKEAAMAKLFASETAMWVTTKAIQIHGGYGYIKDYPVERFFRDAKVTEIYEGTSEIQRLVIGSILMR